MPRPRHHMRDMRFCRETQTDWHLHAHRAAVPRSTVVARMRHGWEFEAALTTPKLQGWNMVVAEQTMAALPSGVTTQDVLDVLRAAGNMITRANLHRALTYLREKGVLTSSIHMINGKQTCRWSYVPEFVRENTLRDIEEDDDDWTPQPYINPVRARALGLR